MEKNCFTRPPKDWTSKGVPFRRTQGVPLGKTKGVSCGSPKGVPFGKPKNHGDSSVFFSFPWKKCWFICWRPKGVSTLWDAKGSAFWEASLGFPEPRKGKRIANWRDHPNWWILHVKSNPFDHFMAWLEEPPLASPTKKNCYPESCRRKRKKSCSTRPPSEKKMKKNCFTRLPYEGKMKKNCFPRPPRD